MCIYRTKRGFEFESTQLDLPIPAKTNGENDEKYDGRFSFGDVLLAPLQFGGVDGFSFGLSSSSSINGRNGSISRDNGVDENKEDASFATAATSSFGALAATTPAGIVSSGAATAASRFSFRASPYQSVMSLPTKGTKAKAEASAPAFSFGAASLSSTATPSPHLLLPWHWSWPSYLSPEFTDHTEEATESPDCIPEIFHHHIENGGGQRVPLSLYGEN